MLRAYDGKLAGTYKYKYNGKELQDELGLNVTAMDYRQYDPAIGRFTSMDVLSELEYDWTPYRFGFDNPVVWSDPSGLFETRKEAREYRREHGIKGGITKQNDGTFSINDKKNGVSYTKGDDTDFTATDANDNDGVVESILVSSEKKSDTKSQQSSDTNNSSPGFSPWGPSLIALGQPIIPKSSPLVRAVMGKAFSVGVNKSTSIASLTLRPIAKVSVNKVVGKTVGSYIAKKAGTRVLGGVLARFVPYVGWGLFANDVYQNREEIKQWAAEQEATNEANKTNADGTWNAGWNASTCFVKGTLIYSENKFVPIESIKVGDVVYSYNVEKDKVELSKVTNTLNRETQGIYEIIAGAESINVTAEHPIYVVSKGWIKVKDLKAGDVLKSSDDEATIKISSIKKLVKTETVYNIEVDGNHNYFITNSTILVHNKNISEIKKNQDNSTKKSSNNE